MAKLTVKQRRFVDEYCENRGNGVKAVYEAGYQVNNNNSAAATASRLLRNVNIRMQKGCQKMRRELLTYYQNPQRQTM